MTPKTVEIHLSNAYRKLDISGRRELAAALAGVGAGVETLGWRTGETPDAKAAGRGEYGSTLIPTKEMKMNQLTKVLAVAIAVPAFAVAATGMQLLDRRSGTRSTPPTSRRSSPISSRRRPESIRAT